MVSNLNIRYPFAFRGGDKVGCPSNLVSNFKQTFRQFLMHSCTDPMTLRPLHWLSNDDV